MVTRNIGALPWHPHIGLVLSCFIYIALLGLVAAGCERSRIDSPQRAPAKASLLFTCAALRLDRHSG